MEALLFKVPIQLFEELQYKLTIEVYRVATKPSSVARSLKIKCNSALLLSLKMLL